MKSALQKSNCFSEETKDSQSNPSRSQNNLDSHKLSLSNDCPSLAHRPDCIVSLYGEQVQQQFLNGHSEKFEAQNPSLNTLNLPNHHIDSPDKLDLSNNLYPQGLTIFMPNADTTQPKHQIQALQNIDFKILQSENTPFPPSDFPASLSQPTMDSENLYPERSTAIILEDYGIKMPSASDVNMETASCLWTEDQINSQNLSYLKKRMASQNLPNASFIQNGQQHYPLPYVGALYESYYPFMIYNNHNANHNYNGFEDSQQLQDEMISPNYQFGDDNLGDCEKQFIPRFINKNLRGWQTQPYDSLEFECPETLQSFSSIAHISERHSNVYSSMFQESKQIGCLSSKIYPFQSNCSRPSYNDFQGISNKDALDFKSDRNEITCEEHICRPEINASIISQVIHGQQIYEESAKTEEEEVQKQINVGGIKNSLFKQKQFKYITPVLSNHRVCEDNAKENSSPHKLHIEDFSRPSFQFPSTGKFTETVIQEEEGECLGQEGSAVQTLVMRFQLQQQQQLQKQQSRHNYNSFYYQNHQQDQNQIDYYPQYCTFQHQQNPTQSSQKQGNQNIQGSDQYLYENENSPLSRFDKISVSALKEQQLNNQDVQLDIKNPSAQHSNIVIKLEKECESNEEQSLGSDSKQQDINEDIQKEQEEEEEEQQEEKRLKCYQSDDDTEGNHEIEDEDLLLEHGCKKICRKDNSNEQKLKKKSAKLKRKESDTVIEVRRRQASSSSASCTSGNQNKNKFDTKNLVKNFLNQFLSFVSSDEEKTTIADLLPSINLDQVFQEDLKAFFKHKKYNRALLKEFIHIENYRILFSFFLRNRAQDWITYGRMKDKPSHLRALSNFIYICDNHDEIKSWRFRYNFV